MSGKRNGSVKSIRFRNAMFHQVSSVKPVGKTILEVRFLDGTRKSYDVEPLFRKWPVFESLKTVPGLFRCVHVDAGGYGIAWNEELDLSCDELWFNGKTLAESGDMSAAEDPGEFV